jgi:hypothetical protein
MPQEALMKHVTISNGVNKIATVHLSSCSSIGSTLLRSRPALSAAHLMMGSTPWSLPARVARKLPLLRPLLEGVADIASPGGHAFRWLGIGCEGAYSEATSA